MENLSNELLKRVDLLAEKLQTTAGHLFEAYTLHALFSSLGLFLFAGLLWAGSIFGIYKSSLPCLREDFDPNSNKGCFSCITLVVSALVFVISSLVLVSQFPDILSPKVEGFENLVRAILGQR